LNPSVATDESGRPDERYCKVTVSTLISAARYWPDEQALELCFAGGRRYLYLGVPASVADEFTRTTSRGQFFNEAIRGHFTCHELASEVVPRRRRAAND
jgi:hypothetical protein